MTSADVSRSERHRFLAMAFKDLTIKEILGLIAQHLTRIDQQQNVETGTVNRHGDLDEIAKLRLVKKIIWG